MNEPELPEGWKTIPLENILTPLQIKQVEEILKTNPDEEKVPKLKEYLRKITPPLEDKNILPDYLAYYLYAVDAGIIKPQP